MFFTALGCHLAVYDPKWKQSKTYIFINENCKKGTAAHRYCQRMKSVVVELGDKIKEYIRPGHCNPYGLRKGSATHATSGTTSPPPITSIFLRGEWSMGVVQDIYWKFCQIGDQYLGRCMACLDPNLESFDTLPPHFTKNMDEEPVIKEAFELCFKNVFCPLMRRML